MKIETSAGMLGAACIFALTAYTSYTMQVKIKQV